MLEKDYHNGQDEILLRAKLKMNESIKIANFARIQNENKLIKMAYFVKNTKMNKMEIGAPDIIA